MLPRVAILISGRGSNMEAIVAATRDGVLRGRCEICGVLSSRGDAAGIVRAKALAVPTRVVPSKGEDTRSYGLKLLRALAEWSPDYVVLAGFMRILSPDVIAAYRGRIVNIHPADTAVYQGPDGYGWAAARNLRQTVITVHLVDEGVDTGPVLRRQAVDLSGANTRQEIAQRGLRVEHEMYSECLADLFSGRYEALVSAVQSRNTRE